MASPLEMYSKNMSYQIGFGRSYTKMGWKMTNDNHYFEICEGVTCVCIVYSPTYHIKINTEA